MDLSFTPEEEAFASEVREWLAANLGDVQTFDNFDDEVSWGREWQRRLAAERWVGLHWPAEYGGRGASPVQVAIFNAEYARARAPQLVNRVGLNLAGPTLLAHGTADRFVPFSQGQRLFAAANPPKELFPMDGYDHQHAPGPEFYARLRGFLERAANPGQLG